MFNSIGVTRSVFALAVCAWLSACGGGEWSDLEGGWGEGATGWPDELAGCWVQRFLGDAVDIEEWWQLHPPAGMVHTLVDRSAGEEHSVISRPGSMTATTGRLVELRWGDDGLSEFRRFTPVVVRTGDPVSQVGGARALNRMAYRTSDDGRTWHREDWRTTIQLGAETGYYDEHLSIRLGFDHPIQPDRLPDQLVMTVRLAATVDLGTNAREMDDSLDFSWPAEAVLDPGTGRVRIAADGFAGGPPVSAWLDFLIDQGAWDWMPPMVAEVFARSFVPVLHVDPADPSALFHDLPSAWYTEMLDPPPESVD